METVITLNEFIPSYMPIFICGIISLLQIIMNPYCNEDINKFDSVLLFLLIFIALLPSLDDLDSPLGVITIIALALVILPLIFSIFLFLCISMQIEQEKEMERLQREAKEKEERERLEREIEILIQSRR